MPLHQRIVEDLTKAMKAKDAVRLTCLRMLKTAVKLLQVEKGRDLTDEEILACIGSQIRKGKEAIEEFRKGGREDLARKEEAEIQVLLGYLPQQLTPEEIEARLREIIVELSLRSPKDLGKIMKVAMVRMAGQAEGKEVNEIAKRLLAQASG